MKRVSLASLALISLAHSTALQSMEAELIPVERAQKPEMVVHTLPKELLDDAWVGATYHLSKRPAALRQIQQETAGKTKKSPEVQDWSDDTKKTWDWIYACIFAERLIAKKMFEDWTLKDIQFLAQCVTRLISSHPGEFRKKPLAIPYGEETTLDTAALQALMEKEKLEPDEEQLLRKNYHIFLPNGEEPYNFDGLINTGLTNVKAELEKHKAATDPLSREMGILAAAASVCFDIARLAPFDVGENNSSANEDIGRLLMNCILVQNGIPIIRYPDRKEYKAALFASIRTRNPSAFWELTSRLYETSRTLQNLTELMNDGDSQVPIEIISFDALNAVKSEEELGKLLGLQKEEPSAVSEAAPAKQIIKASGQKVNIKCAHCAQKPKKKKALLQCSRCKSAFYCSQKCQNSHWSKHKSACSAPAKSDN